MMNKIFVILLLAVTPISAISDAIYFPYAYTCYSVELIYSFEKVKKPRNTINYWGGIGYIRPLISRSFYFPAFGLELAVEKRHYFQADMFKNFFVSAYLGAAIMSDFSEMSSIGLVPGLKLNYKIQATSKLIIEPYLSVSMPIIYQFEDYPRFGTAPAFTLSVRLGFSSLKKDNQLKSEKSKNTV